MSEDNSNNHIALETGASEHKPSRAMVIESEELSDSTPWRRYLPRCVRSLPTGWSTTGNELVVVTFLYSLIALAITFPLVLNFSGYILGDMESDVWKHVWGMWWTKVNLLDLNVLPLRTNILNYPYGGALFFIDPLNALISTPLQLIWSVPVVFNLVVLFNIVLAGMGGFCLARYLCKNRYAAFFAGVVYSCSAYMAAFINSGVTEAINIGWIAFFALFCIRSLEKANIADAVRAGVFFALACISCWYYGAFCFLLAFFYYCYVLLRRYRLFLRHFKQKLQEWLRFPWSGPVSLWIGTLGCAALLWSWLSQLLAPFHTGLIKNDLLGLSVALVVVFLGSVFLINLAYGCPERFRLLSGLWSLLPACLVVAVVATELWAVGGAIWDSSPFLGLKSVPLVCAQALLVFSLLYIGWCRLWSRQSKNSIMRQLLLPFSTMWPSVVAIVFIISSVLALSLTLEGLKTASSAWSLCGACLVFCLSLALLYLQIKRGEAESSAQEQALEEDCSGRTEPVLRRPLGLLATYRRFLQQHRSAVAFLCLVCMALVHLAFPGAGLPAFVSLWLSSLLLLQIALVLVANLEAAVHNYLQALGSPAFSRLAADLRLRMLVVPMVMGAVAGCLIVGPVTAFRDTINGSQSLVFRGRQETNVDIHLSRRFMNVTCLIELFRPGKLNTSRSYTVDKLTRVSYVGWVTLGVVLYGFLAGYRRRHRGFWLFAALVFTMFSMGPFLYITDNIYSSTKSPIYMLFYRYFPSFGQISIPCRFIALVMLSLGVLAAFTLSSLYRKRSALEQLLLTLALTLALFFDVAIFSPAPFPIPLSSVRIPEYCHALAQDPHEVGLIDFPIQRYKGELLPGEYFFFQLVHRKSIPNRVEGTIPLFVFQNAFSNYLFVLEHSRADIPPREQATLERGLEDLSRFRFRYLVIHNNLIRFGARERMHVLLRYYLGQPQVFPDNVYVYRIPPRLHFPARQSELHSTSSEKRARP